MIDIKLGSTLFSNLFSYALTSKAKWLNFTIPLLTTCFKEGLQEQWVVIPVKVKKAHKSLGFTHKEWP